MKMSILSPVFNEERHLPEMLGSLRAQSHVDWEVLFVDDGSTDGTVSAIQAAAREDPRIQLVTYGAKVGKALAFNLAFAASSGDGIVLLAGDDRLPPESLRWRSTDLASCPPGSRGLASYKLKTFSDDPEHDGMTLPRGDATSMSGGSLTFSRELAQVVFPIPDTLPSEDFWLGFAGPAVTRRHVRHPVVVLEYRIHPGNSNPRNRSFEQMDASITSRHEAFRLLLEQHRFQLPSDARTHLDALYTAELLRRDGDTAGILRVRGLSWPERASMASMSRPDLWRVRGRFYARLSGWQGR